MFLIDAQVHGGSSGSPALIETNDGYKLVGLLAEAYEVNRDVFLARKKKPKVREAIGIGVVFKVKAIVEVLDKDRVVGEEHLVAIT